MEEENDNGLDAMIKFKEICKKKIKKYPLKVSYYQTNY